MYYSASFAVLHHLQRAQRAQCERPFYTSGVSWLDNSSAKVLPSWPRYFKLLHNVVKEQKTITRLNYVPNVKVQIGQRFGRLIVVKRLQNDEHGGSVFDCRCDCGTAHHPVRGAFLSRKIPIKSCGCSRADHLARIHGIRRRGWGEAAKHAAYAQTKQSAKARGYEWKISEDKFHELAQQACRYCGSPPSNETAPRYGRYGTYRYNGIDRQDSTKGYVEGNMVPCCWRCNRAKCNMTLQEFLDWAGRLYAHSARSYSNDTTSDFEI